MEQDQIDEDAMAAMMGFGSFGGTKKRKLDLVSIDTTPAAQSAKLTQENAPKNMPERREDHQVPSGTHRRGNNGVRNENGDMAYFMPSFIDDPWADLVKKRAEKQIRAPS